MPESPELVRVESQIKELGAIVAERHLRIEERISASDRSNIQATAFLKEQLDELKDDITITAKDLNGKLAELKEGQRWATRTIMLAFMGIIAEAIVLFIRSSSG